MTRSVTRMPRYPPQPCAHVVRRPSDGTAPGSVDSLVSPFFRRVRLLDVRADNAWMDRLPRLPFDEVVTVL
jgi:hypothetical protein